MRAASSGNERHFACVLDGRLSSRFLFLGTGALFVVFLGWWGVYGLHAEGELSKDRPPSIVVCDNDTFDFGTVSQERPQNFSQSFSLRNTSDQPVPIIKMASDCGCVVPKDHPGTIEPGKSIELPVSVNVGGKPGPFRKKVTVLLGTSPASTIVLSIQGRIAASAAFLLAPSQLDFGNVITGETAYRTITIARYDASPVSFRNAQADSEALRVHEVASGVKDDSTIHLTFSLDATGLNPGHRLNATVRLETEHSGYAEATIPTIARIVAQSDGLVDSIYVDRLTADEFRDIRLDVDGCVLSPISKVMYRGDGPLTVDLLNHVQDTVTPIGPAIVRIRLTSQPDSSQLYRGRCLVHFSDKKHPREIPVTVYARR